MDKRKLEKFEKLLLARRAEVFAGIGEMKKSTDSTSRDASGDLSSHAYHMADQGTDAMEREKSFYLASKSRRYLYHIDEALRRIKDKTYGLCLTCGNPISEGRLEAVPHARFCIECKEKEEAGKSSR